MERRTVVAIAVLGTFVLAPILLLASGESLDYTMTLNADISAGVLQTSSCKIVSGASVVSIRPVGRIWMFHSESFGVARVKCGLFGRNQYTFEVVRPVRLEIGANDRVEVGETIGFYAVGYDASGRRISSEVKVDHWRVEGPLVEKAGDSSCEFPPWCGGPGPASFQARATAEGTATVEAVVGNEASGKKTVTVVAKSAKP